MDEINDGCGILEDSKYNKVKCLLRLTITVKPMFVKCSIFEVNNHSKAKCSLNVVFLRLTITVKPNVH